MKLFLPLLALSLLPSLANAGSLRCVGEQIAYSESRPDGGPHIIANIRLVLETRTLIDEGLGRPDQHEANFELVGERKEIKTTRPDRYNVATYFEQTSRVSQENVDPALFSGKVLCKEVRYVGPPRP